MALNPEDQFFKFVNEEKMGFINAEIKHPTRPRPKKKSNSGNDCPLIYDKRGSDPEKKEYKLTETGGFILTLVMQEVARDLIAQIYSSEYGVNLPTAQARVNKFIEDLITAGILKVTTKTSSHEDDIPKIKLTDTFTGIRYVFFDVGTNQVFHIRVGYVT